jgi:Cu2+-exporting ATPase
MEHHHSTQRQEKRQDHPAQMQHDHNPPMGHAGHDHHKMMISDFRRRFLITLLLTIPVMLLSPMIQHWLGFDISFQGSSWLLFGLSTIVFFYGGMPFLKGLVGEMRAGNPGMMTLIGIAITVAYIYSVAIVFGLEEWISFGNCVP